MIYHGTNSLSVCERTEWERKRETLAERISVYIYIYYITTNRKVWVVGSFYDLGSTHLPSEFNRNRSQAHSRIVLLVRRRCVHCMYMYTRYFPSRPKEYHIFFIHLPVCTTFMRAQSLWACPRFDDLNLNHCKYTRILRQYAILYCASLRVFDIGQVRYCTCRWTHHNIDAYLEDVTASGKYVVEKVLE